MQQQAAHTKFTFAGKCGTVIGYIRLAINVEWNVNYKENKHEKQNYPRNNILGHIQARYNTKPLA